MQNFFSISIGMKAEMGMFRYLLERFARRRASFIKNMAVDLPFFLVG